MNDADLIAKLTEENERLKNRSEFLSRDLSEAQSQLAVATGTVTPVTDNFLLRCSECKHIIGFLSNDGGPDHDYGPRCPGCGKLIDKEGKNEIHDNF